MGKVQVGGKENILRRGIMKNKHKHIWHFLRIYYKQIFPYTDKRFASFICDCGLIKEVEVRRKDGKE